MIKGMHNIGTLTALKHLPGHGSAKGDTHIGFTDVTPVWNVREKDPFFRLCSKADSVMTAHIFNSTLDTTYPATLSRSTLEGFRAEANYNGVFISDDLHMGAIQKCFGFQESVVQALNAGNDLLIFSNNKLAAPDVKSFTPSARLQDTVLRIIEEAIAAEKLSEKRFNEAALRVLKMKERLNSLGQKQACSA
jgi:beta-N-acetylhexosaminidase